VAMDALVIGDRYFVTHLFTWGFFGCGKRKLKLVRKHMFIILDIVLCVC
jgi:hypothetical protein